MVWYVPVNQYTVIYLQVLAMRAYEQAAEPAGGTANLTFFAPTWSSDESRSGSTLDKNANVIGTAAGSFQASSGSYRVRDASATMHVLRPSQISFRYRVALGKWYGFKHGMLHLQGRTIQVSKTISRVPNMTADWG